MVDTGLPMPVDQEMARAFASVEKRYGPPVVCESSACHQARDLYAGDRIAETDYLRGMCRAHGFERLPTEDLARAFRELEKDAAGKMEMMVLPVGWVSLEDVAKELARRGVLYVVAPESKKVPDWMDEVIDTAIGSGEYDEGEEDEPTEQERASANGAWSEEDEWTRIVTRPTAKERDTFRRWGQEG